MAYRGRIRGSRTRRLTFLECILNIGICLFLGAVWLSAIAGPMWLWTPIVLYLGRRANTKYRTTGVTVKGSCISCPEGKAHIVQYRPQPNGPCYMFETSEDIDDGPVDLLVLPGKPRSGKVKAHILSQCAGTSTKTERSVCDTLILVWMSIFAAFMVCLYYAIGVAVTYVLYGNLSWLFNEQVARVIVGMMLAFGWLPWVILEFFDEQKGSLVPEDKVMESLSTTKGSDEEKGKCLEKDDTKESESFSSTLAESETEATFISNASTIDSVELNMV